MFKATLFCAALVTMVPALGCRRVVIINFDGKMLANDAMVTKLLITGIDPRKDERELSGLQQTIGYYDVSNSSLTLSVEACGGEVELSHQEDTLPIVNDEVTVTLQRIPRALCQIGLPSLDAGQSGTGGADGMGGTGIGGSSGSGGGAGSNDAAAGGSGGGDIDGGGSGGGGSGGDGAAGDCDDAGHDSKVDAGSCPIPDPGSPDLPVVATNPACTAYCTDMATICPGIYADAPQCQRYCTLAGWPTGGNNDRDDTIACRDTFAQMARVLSGDPGKCNIAGPSGGPTSECGSSAGPCGKFCQAWAGICGGNAQLCLATCAAAPASSISCRFPWLLAASSDRHYCPLVDLDSTCSLPGC